MSFTYRLNSQVETSPSWATLSHMIRSVDVAECKNVSNVRQSRYEDMHFTGLDGKFRIVRLQKRPLTNTVSKASATSRKTAPVSFLSSDFLLTLSTRRRASNQKNQRPITDIYQLESGLFGW
jgi:hypothetical protein